MVPQPLVTETALTECFDMKDLPISPSLPTRSSSDDNDDDTRSTPPPPPPTRTRRLSENRGLTLKVDTCSGVVEKSMYFPGCGKALPTNPSEPGSGGSGLAQRRGSFGRLSLSGNSTPRTLSLNSSPSASGEDSPVERLSIVLTHTGFVEDVVTPWQPRTAEAAFFNTDGANTTVGSAFQPLVDSSEASTPPPGATAAPPSKARRRVSFTDEKGADGDGEVQPLVSLRVFSSEQSPLDRLSTLSDRDSVNSEPGQASADAAGSEEGVPPPPPQQQQQQQQLESN